jgi:hypothetical protein
MTIKAPRMPTPQETREMIECHHNTHRSDGLEVIEWLAENACIAVFDNYQQNYGSYSGKLMMVAWPSMPEHYEVYIWLYGKICYVPFEWTMADREKI